MGNFKELNLDEFIENQSEDKEFNYFYEIEDIEFNFIKNLRNKRKEMNLTQKQMSQLTGMSQQAISRIEKYGNKPTLNNLIKYIKALDLDINKIFK